VTVPLFTLIFARIYLSNSLTDPAVFTLPLGNTTALYRGPSSLTSLPGRVARNRRTAPTLAVPDSAYGPQSVGAVLAG
jgi:hypothetical protein